MGAGQSNPVPGGGTEGYHILRVSTELKKNLAIYVGLAGVSLERLSRKNSHAQMFLKLANRSVLTVIFSCKCAETE